MEIIFISLKKSLCKLDDSLEKYFRKKCSCLVVEARVGFLEYVCDGFYLGGEDEPRMSFTAEADSRKQVNFNCFCSIFKQIIFVF